MIVPSITALPTAAVHAAIPPLELVTVYTPPATCAPQWHQVTNRSSVVLDGNDPNCLPFRAPVTQFSPGLCQSGLEFASYTWYTRSARHEIHTVFNGFCCSPGHTLYTSNFANTFCATVLPGPVTAIATPVLITKTNSDPATTSTASPTTTVFSSSVQAYSPMFVVFWQESDLPLFPETQASSLASLMGVDWAPAQETTADLSSSSAASSPGPDNAHSGSGDLPPLAIAFIAVVATGLFILLFWLAYLVPIRRAKQKKVRNSATDASEEPQDQSAMIEAQASYSKHFSGGDWSSELHSDQSISTSAGSSSL